MINELYVLRSAECADPTFVGGQPQVTLGLTITPNPAVDTASLNWNAPFDGNGQIRIFDISGKLVDQSGNISFPAGPNSIQLNINNLKRGPYLVVFSTADFSRAIKMLIK
jgi:hypothetical protein